MGENTLMIGTDCGLGGRVHPQIAWAKLRALRSRAKSRKVEFESPGTGLTKRKKAQN